MGRRASYGGDEAAYRLPLGSPSAGAGFTPTWPSGEREDPLGRDPEVPVGTLGRDAAPRRALEEPELEQVGLDDVFDRVGLLPHGRRQRREPDRPSAELDDHGGQDGEVELVQALLVP